MRANGRGARSPPAKYPPRQCAHSASARSRWASSCSAPRASWPQRGGGPFLALAFFLYDSSHKGNPAAPMIMGLCRALVYCGAAAAATTALPTAIVPAACALLAYVAGLTYAAQQESFDRVGNLWPLLLLIAPMVLALPALAKGVVGALVYPALIGCAAYAAYLLAARPMPGAVPRAVALLIAGISLVDAALLGAAGHALPALAAMMGFPITLLLQRYIPGT